MAALSEPLPATERLEPDGYLQPSRWRIHYQCQRCGHKYSQVTTKLDGKDKPCPVKVCQAEARHEEVMREAHNLAKIIAEQRAPEHIGDNPMNRAIDRTAEVVMTDYGLTDLKDNIREGETMAPRLGVGRDMAGNPMNLQSQADNYFSGKAVADAAGVQNRQAQMMGMRAIHGRYRNMAISPNVAGVGRQPGEKALRSLGKIS